MKKFSVSEVLISGTNRLSAEQIDSPRLDAEILLANVLGWRRLSLYVDSKKILPLEKVLGFNELISKRLKKIPVAYIIGAKEFMGLKFTVNESVLIPRPETEILAEYVGEFLRSRGGGLFADLGTGSGAICVSVLKFVSSARAVAVDISDKALEVAQINAEKFNVDDRLEIFCGDLFAPLKGKIFDAIVSNPPYIASDDLVNLQEEVKSEPILALDGGEDGLNFYRRIISEASQFLVQGGLLALEVGFNQAVFVKNFMQYENFHDIKILKDLANLDRVVVGFK